MQKARRHGCLALIGFVQPGKARAALLRCQDFPCCACLSHGALLCTSKASECFTKRGELGWMRNREVLAGLCPLNKSSTRIHVRRQLSQRSREPEAENSISVTADLKRAISTGLAHHTKSRSSLLLISYSIGFHICTLKCEQKSSF